MANPDQTTNSVDFSILKDPSKLLKEEKELLEKLADTSDEQVIKELNKPDNKAKVIAELDGYLERKNTTKEGRRYVRWLKNKIEDKFKAAEATPPTGNETTPPAGNETTPPAGNETTPPAGNETTPPAGNETTPPAGNETTPPAGNETTPPAGNEEEHNELSEAEMQAKNALKDFRITGEEFKLGINPDIEKKLLEMVAMHSDGSLGAIEIGNGKIKFDIGQNQKELALKGFEVDMDKCITGQIFDINKFKKEFENAIKEKITTLLNPVAPAEQPGQTSKQGCEGSMCPAPKAGVSVGGAQGEGEGNPDGDNKSSAENPAPKAEISVGSVQSEGEGNPDGDNKSGAENPAPKAEISVGSAQGEGEGNPDGDNKSSAAERQLNPSEQRDLITALEGVDKPDQWGKGIKLTSILGDYSGYAKDMIPAKMIPKGINPEGLIKSKNISIKDPEIKDGLICFKLGIAGAEFTIPYEFTINPEKITTDGKLSKEKLANELKHQIENNPMQIYAAAQEAVSSFKG